MVTLTPEQIRQVEEDIKRRSALIVSAPAVIKQEVESLRLKPGEIEIQIQQRNGLFVDIKRSK